MLCPFCAERLEEGALVCRRCQRDVAVPEHLRKEHDELLHMRDALQAGLAEATAELDRYRRRLFRRGKRSS
jgi:DNA-binding GntR family transcriptional regulator